MLYPIRFVVLAVAMAATAMATAQSVLKFEPRRELFVDTFLIESLDGVALRLNHPTYAGTALEFDKPWEGAFAGYASVLSDGERYHLYYRGLPEAGGDRSDIELTCYATSEDGITWEKPNLGLYEVNGTKENNVVLAYSAPFSHNFAPFYDTNPDCPPSEKFKAIAGSFHDYGDLKGGLYMFVSADGLEWKRLSDEPAITKGNFDSQNIGFWSETEQQYLSYLRIQEEIPGQEEKIRAILRSTSPDFRTWSEPELMTYGDTPREHLYTNQTQPYFRAPHIYIALPMRFLPNRQVLTFEEAEMLGVRTNAEGKYSYATSCADAVLMSTRGGLEYDRTFMEAFIRPGVDLGNWASRAGMTVHGMIQTGDAELSIYKQFHYAQDSAFLGRYTLRLDGFASVNAPYEGGSFVTKPFVAVGDRLSLNFATSAAGDIYVEVLDESGKPVPGYEKEQCVPIIGDRIDHTVVWESAVWKDLSDRVVRLKFSMKDADLYSICWTNE